MLFRRCRHVNVRCIHGDEIMQTLRTWRRPEIARTRCTDCGKALYKVELPHICSETNEPHQSFQESDTWTPRT